MKYFLICCFILFSGLKVLSQENAYTNSELQLKEVQKKEAESLEYWLVVAEDQRDVSDQMRFLLKLGEHYYSPMGNRAKAYDLAVRLEKLTDEHPNDKAIPEVETRLSLLLGKLNNDQEEYIIGLNYFLEAKDLSTTNNQTTFSVRASNHIAETYSLLGRNKEAIRLFNSLVAENNPEFRALAMGNLASHYIRNNQLDSTLYYARKSLISQAPPLELSERHRLIGMAHLYVTGDHDSARYHGQQALSYALQVMAPQQELNAHNILMKVYDSLDNAQKGNFHMKRYYSLLEAQDLYTDALKIGRINAEKERREAALQKELADEKLKGRNRIIWLIAIAILVLLCALLLILRQLRQIRKQNLIIEAEKQRAEISEQYKEQFLANMSHEIRTPMHAISGMLNALLRRVPRKDQKTFLDVMKISADNLLVLLNDALDMSKVEAGHLEIERNNIRPADIMMQVLELFQSRAQEKNLKLTADISPDFPECVLGDAARLSQVLINLVGNALKFTERGHVNLKAELSNNKLLIVVEDTGIGIPQNEIKTVLDAFTQASNIERGKHGGSGLGLSICKQIIELQNGRVWVKSMEGEGSTFYIELPLIPCKLEANASEMPLALEEAMQRGAELTGLRVLIAEDVEFNVMVIRDDLEWFIPAVDLTVVDNGKAALEVFQAKAFDIVLMDVQMPEMNGYDASRAIRKTNGDGAKIPIIAMTASLLKQQVDLCFEAGMDAYIPKPYKPELLLEKIYSLIEKRKVNTDE